MEMNASTRGIRAPCILGSQALELVTTTTLCGQQRDSKGFGGGWKDNCMRSIGIAEQKLVHKGHL